MKYNWFILTTLLVVLGGCQSSELEDPSTVISFSLPEPSTVKLTVINSYEVTVSVLVDGDLPSGNHSNLFTAPDLAEGVYFYILKTTSKSTGSTSTIKKPVLLRK